MLWEVKGQAERESRRGTWAQRFPCPLHRSPWDISSPAGARFWAEEWRPQPGTSPSKGSARDSPVS